MSTKALVNKSRKQPKFSTRKYTRCELCGRSRAVYRKFKLCRLCLRKLALEGKIPGLKKASW
jgi:small subunit ribosomal protein S14